MTVSETATNNDNDDAVGHRGPTAVSARKNRRRFITASLIGMAVVAIPYCWVLFVMWNPAPNLLRNVYQNGYGGGFYDLQARAILSGHLYVPKGSLALETWMHNGRDYTYFGVFPSLLRIPVLLLTHRFDGKLTALSLLLSWLVTGLFASMLIWRIRIMLRGDALLGRAETVTLGVLVASITGGSVLVYLAANPYVYSEDKAWSVALSLGAFLALLGMLQRPSWGRVFSIGALVLATNLTRVTEGYACVIGALLVGLWFALGRHGPENRQWWKPMVAVAIISVAAGSAVSWAKFGVLFGLPLNDYEAFHVLHDNRINGGRYFDLAYLPSTLFSYLQPGGLRVTSLFPFVTLPAGPTRTVGNILFDNRTRTTSVTASMPLLFLLSCLGLVSAFRRRASEQARMLRIILFASATTTAAVLFYGWIADRYLADFLPFLVVASAVGAIVLWTRMERRGKRARVAVTACVVVLGVFSVAANVALSITPTDAFSTSQASQFLKVQNTVSNLTGHPLSGQIQRGNHLPYWAPADTVFIAGTCNALYVSNGESYAGVLNQQAEHRTWVVVEQGRGYAHTLKVTFRDPTRSSGQGITLLRFGSSTLLMHSASGMDGYVAVWFTLQDPHFSASSAHGLIQPGIPHTITLDTDRYADELSVSLDGNVYLDSPITTAGQPTVRIAASGSYTPFLITAIASKPPAMPLCRTLAAEH
jgi:hypothetical protein